MRPNRASSRAAHRVLTTMVVVCAAVGVACASVEVPPPDSSAEQEVIEQGRRADRQIRARFGVYEEMEVTAHVSRIGDEIAALSDWPSLPWEFRVLDTPVVNALAVPGGFVYVTRGLLAHVNSEAELAGVLGHEIAHVTERHIAEQQRRSTFANLGLLLGSVLAPAEVADVVLGSGLGQNALGLVLLKFSRDQELEADRVGIRYAAEAGYDPHAIGDFFRTLQALEQRGGDRQVPGWASTHPEVDDRLEQTASSARGVLASMPQTDRDALISGRSSHLRAINGIVYGADPRHGYTDGSDFYHPELRFQLAFPIGWEISNLPTEVLAVEPDGEAGVRLTLADQRDGEGLEQTVSRILSSDDVRVTGSSRTRVNGLPAVQVRFEVHGDGGITRGLGLWVEHRGRVYQILGLTAPADFPAYSRLLRRTLYSFRPLNDADRIDVRPARIDVRAVESSVELRAFVTRADSSAVEPETIALINGRELGDRLEAGTLIKLVVGSLRYADS